MKKKIVFVMILATLFGACGPARVGSNPDPIQHEERLLLLDRAYKSKIRLVSEQARKLDSGQLEVIMEIQNQSNKDLWTDIQVIFKDADGVEVDKTNWEPQMFHRRELTTYKKVSLPATAVDYRIVIRAAKTEG
ncbi:MAG: hypothetical protein KDD46_06950 [Bdellovibrionales bacterium]|nr:hypothetical protein [Bdellovibrionales bacterium]